MRKSGILVVCVALLAIGGLQLSSCKKHETPVKPKLSFAQATYTVKESDGTLSVPLVLDRAAGEAVTITYELGGTATDKVSAGTGAFDYEITSSYLEAKIAKGALSDTIQIKLYSDFSVEDDELIEITVKSVDSGNIEITNNDICKITIKQEDGLIVFLNWTAPTADSTADMDLLLRVATNTAPPWDGILNGSVSESFAGPEFIFIPYVATNSFNSYGLSYTYYDGSMNHLRFGVSFIDLINGVAEDVSTQVTDSATYTKANINKWTDVNTTLVVQTFQKSGSKFSDPSDISVPASGSRVASSGHLTSSLQRSAKLETMSNLMKSVIESRKH